ncbi:MAG: class I SAM-dependent methyltransferase [Actinobacteria bacterium]|nr:class I SAM-dependent methyltransferase [Actinomycetota bacterium]
MASITVEQYAVGVVGLGLIRHWYVDGAANEDRINEMREILDQSEEFPWNLELNPQERDLIEGYSEWAKIYDGPNPLIETEEQVVQPLLRRLVKPQARVLDAACGTGRHAQFLDSLECICVGVDQSIEMLDVAKNKLPGGRFELGTLERLPFEDNELDLAVVSLALCHLSDPTAAVTELARVVRPDGTVVVTDPHPSSGIIGGQGFYGSITEGQPMRWVRNHYHSASTWLRAFRAAQFSVEDCIEAPLSDEQIAGLPASMLYPEAALAALSGIPSLWVWELRVQK